MQKTNNARARRPNRLTCLDLAETILKVNRPSSARASDNANRHYLSTVGCASVSTTNSGDASPSPEELNLTFLTRFAKAENLRNKTSKLCTAVEVLIDAIEAEASPAVGDASAARTASTWRTFKDLPSVKALGERYENARKAFLLALDEASAVGIDLPAKKISPMPTVSWHDFKGLSGPWQPLAEKTTPLNDLPFITVRSQLAEYLLSLNGVFNYLTRFYISSKESLHEGALAKASAKKAAAEAQRTYENQLIKSSPVLTNQKGNASIKVGEIAEQLQSKSRVTDEQATVLSDLDPQSVIGALFSEGAVNPAIIRFLQKNDVFELVFCLKSMDIRELKLRLFKNGHKDLYSSFKDRDWQSENYYTKTFKMYFVALNTPKGGTAEQIIVALKKAIFDVLFGDAFSPHVLLEKTQIKRIYPPARVTPPRTVAMAVVGTGDPIKKRPSSRSFLINLSSNLITGASDDFTIRVPLMSASTVAGSFLDNSRHVLTQSINVPLPESPGGTDVLQVRLALKTNRSDALAPFYPVDYVACSGFASAAVSSAIPQVPYSVEDPELDTGESFSESQSVHDAISSLGDRRSPLHGEGEGV
jgi:hypothetical protein